MIWSLSFFPGARRPLHNETNMLLLSLPNKSPRSGLLWRPTPLVHFLHGASKNTDMIGKSRTQLPTNAIKAANKTTLNYEIGLWHDYSLGAFYGSLANQKTPHHIHQGNKGPFYSKLKCVFKPPPAVLRFCGSPLVMLCSYMIAFALLASFVMGKKRKIIGRRCWLKHTA